VEEPEKQDGVAARPDGDCRSPKTSTTGSHGYGRAFWISLAILFILATVPRIAAYNAARERPLEPDAAAFSKIASRDSGFYSPSLREPFFIALHKLAFAVFGRGPQTIRLQTMVFSILLVALVFLVSWRLLEYHFARMAPALVLAVTPYMSFSATRGLRLELFLFLTFVLAAVLFLKSGKIPWWRWAAAGVVSAMLILTRQAAIPMVVVILAAAFIKQMKPASVKRVVAGAAVAAGLVLLLTVPFFVSQAREYGDPFYISKRDATFWKNQEFRDRPGYPSSAEVSADPYKPPLVSPMHYMFGMHSIGEVAARMVKGLCKSFAFYYRHALLYLWPLLLLAVPGVILLLARGKWEWPILFITVLLPFSFIIPISVVGHDSVDARFAMHGYPFVAFFVGAGFDWVIGLFSRLRARD